MPGNVPGESPPVNPGRKVQHAAGKPGRSKNAARNCAAVPERRIAAKPLFPPTESEARGVYAAMEMWTEVRRRVLTGELSKRAACQEYGINWRTLGKMLAHAEPPGYRRRVNREKPILRPHLAWIHEVLEQGREAPKKQHHTAERLRPCEGRAWLHRRRHNGESGGPGVEGLQEGGLRAPLASTGRGPSRLRFCLCRTRL